ncbi:MAG: hypothetical protein H5U11_08020 [Rhizobium sp.]|nr:hypothetical protein [Rhizobium sp.]
MPKPISLEQIASWTIEKRQTLYRNCMERIENPEAVRLVELIVSSGLPYRKSKEIAHGDPEMTAIEIIVNSPAHEVLILDAVANDLPPLQAIEPLIVARLGADYRGDNGGTIAAGYLIAKRLYALGYTKGPARKMPEGSVAKTASTYHK